MITNEVINEIRNKVNIVDIISNYVPLTKKGKNYFGLCPFHDDHSPSMSVSLKNKYIPALYAMQQETYLVLFLNMNILVFMMR